MENEDVVKFTQNLKQEDGSNIWLLGGTSIVDSFMKDQLIDEYIITVIPTILGNGIPLFKKDNPEMKLLLKESKNFSGGIVQLHYTSNNK